MNWVSKCTSKDYSIHSIFFQEGKRNSWTELLYFSFEKKTTPSFYLFMLVQIFKIPEDPTVSLKDFN